MSEQNFGNRNISSNLELGSKPLKKSNVNLLQKSDIDKFVNKNKENEHHEERESWSDCLFNIRKYRQTSNDAYLNLAVEKFKQSY